MPLRKRKVMQSSTKSRSGTVSARSSWVRRNGLRRGWRASEHVSLFQAVQRYGCSSLFAVAMGQYMETISADDAWLIADETLESEVNAIDRELKPTNSARRVKALVEQVTGT